MGNAQLANYLARREGYSFDLERLGPVRRFFKFPYKEVTWYSYTVIHDTRWCHWCYHPLHW